MLHLELSLSTGSRAFVYFKPKAIVEILDILERSLSYDLMLKRLNGAEGRWSRIGSQLYHKFLIVIESVKVPKKKNDGNCCRKITFV